jgi:PKHD-type hydroxylase
MFWQFKSKNYQDWCYSEGLFTPPEIKEILSWKDILIEKPATVGTSYTVIEEVRKSNVRWIEPKFENEWLFDRIEDIFKQMNDQYFHLNINGFDNMQLTEYSADENEEGYYHSHVDSGTNNTGRKLSMTIQLTDPKKYEGGDFYLYPTSLNPVAVVKNIGAVTVFRSNIIHEVTPVTKGTRDSLVIWAQGPEAY